MIHNVAPPRRDDSVQDFEPLFYPVGSPDYQTALRSYQAYPDLVCLTKTEWNRQQVQAQTGVECVVVGPSVVATS